MWGLAGVQVGRKGNIWVFTGGWWVRQCFVGKEVFCEVFCESGSLRQQVNGVVSANYVCVRINGVLAQMEFLLRFQQNLDLTTHIHVNVNASCFFYQTDTWIRISIYRHPDAYIQRQLIYKQTQKWILSTLVSNFLSLAYKKRMTITIINYYNYKAITWI